MKQASFVKLRMLRKDDVSLYIWNCLQKTLNRIQMKQASFVKWRMLRKDDVSLYPKRSVYLLVHEKRQIIAF